MKKHLIIIVILVIAGNCYSQNLGFESGFNSYNLSYGVNNQFQKKILWFKWCANKGITGETAGVNSPMHHKIMDNNIIAEQFDPVIGNNILPTVIEGRYSARIGSRGLGYIAQKLTKVIPINSQNSNFKFNYALVTFDPTDHNKCTKPYFQLIIKKANGNKVYEEKIIADNNNPYFKKRNGFIYKDWDCKSINLSRFEGKTLTFEFTTASCSEGAPDHFSYVYIDGINSDVLEPIFNLEKQTYCVEDEVLANASDTKGETDHFWSIQESDANWNAVPNTEVSKWFTAQQAGSLSLKDFYKSFGKSFRCNTYYRIKLAVKNNCVGWKEVTKLINFTCPKADAGRDICCSNLTSLPVLGGLDANPNYTYEWFPKYGLSHPNSAKTFIDCDNEDINEFDCFNYTLKVTDENGCQSKDEVSIYFDKPNGHITKIPGCCDYKLKIYGGCYSSITWSTGEQNVTEISITEPGEYRANLSNACGDELLKIVVTNVDLKSEFKKIYPKIIAGSGFTPNNDGVNDELELFHFAADAPLKGQTIAYNATDYELYVVDRGGVVHLVSSGTTCTGFYNGEIKWDGKINGQLVQDGVYTYFLKLKNCDYPWIEAEIVTGQEYECIKCGFTFIGDKHCPGFFNGCKEYGLKNISSTRPHVTIIR